MPRGLSSKVPAGTRFFHAPKCAHMSKRQGPLKTGQTKSSCGELDAGALSAAKESRMQSESSLSAHLKNLQKHTPAVHDVVFPRPPGRTTQLRSHPLAPPAAPYSVSGSRTPAPAGSRRDGGRRAAAAQRAAAQRDAPEAVHRLRCWRHRSSCPARTGEAPFRGGKPLLESGGKRFASLSREVLASSLGGF